MLLVDVINVYKRLLCLEKNYVYKRLLFLQRLLKIINQENSKCVKFDFFLIQMQIIALEDPIDILLVRGRNRSTVGQKCEAVTL